jgi:hypothetical protein
MQINKHKCDKASSKDEQTHASESYFSMDEDVWELFVAYRALLLMLIGQG